MNSRSHAAALTTSLVLLSTIACSLGSGSLGGSTTTPGASAGPTASEAGANPPSLQATPFPPSGSAASSDFTSRVSNSLNLTLGIGGAASPPASFHIEARGTTPAVNPSSGKVSLTQYTISADVQGKDVHLQSSSTRDGKPLEAVDGYIIGDKEYQVVNGQPKESLATVSLAWAAWPLDPVFALAIAGTGPTAQGEAAVEGRQAEVYALDSANAAPGVLEAIGGFTAIRASHGTVWIDKETGALLKAVLDYDAEFTDPQSHAVVGSGSGHAEILVSKVGAVTVSLP